MRIELSCVFLLACGDAFSAVSAPELAADGGPDASADASSTSWSDHWTAPRGDSAAAADVLEELQVDAADPPDTYVSTPQVDATYSDAADEPEASAPLCCWIDWNPNGGCCPAPNDPACAYKCGEVPCIGMGCSTGGCPGSVMACP